MLYPNMHNDVSFLVNDEMVLWEHQSTYNPNMPLRGLLYFTQLYAKHIVHNKLSLFAHRRIELPTPRFVVFYIGRDRKRIPDVMRLSDSFSGDEFDVEVTATVIDINPESGAEVLELCEDLAGYSKLVGKVRELNTSMPLDEAVEGAVKWCIERGILAEYLKRKRAEVVGMLLAEYNEAREREYLRREAIEEGYDEGYDSGYDSGYDKGRTEGFDTGYDKGRTEGFDTGYDKGRTEGRDEAEAQTMATVAAMVQDGILTAEEASRRFGFTVDAIEQARE